MSALGLGCAKTADIDEPCRHFESCSLKGVLFNGRCCVISRINSAAAESRHAFCCSLVRYCSGFLVPRGASLWHFRSHFCASHERTSVNPGVSHICVSQDTSGLSIDSEMYFFASGTIASARTSSPSMPGTQPVSSNISLAVSTRALTSLVIALLMIGSPVLVH